MIPMPDAALRAPSPELRHDAALLGIARELSDGACAALPRQWLRGRKFGLLCADAQAAKAHAFEAAASELGAHVARIRVRLGDASPDEIVRDTALLLSRLYDAVECIDMSPTLLHRLRGSASIPVLVGGSTDAPHVDALAAALMAEGHAAADAGRFALQALLIAALA
jgi:ornithine carbamoyltransferase